MANRLMVGLSGSAEDKSAVVIIPIRRSHCGWSLQGHDVRTQKIYHFLHPQSGLRGNLKITHSRTHSLDIAFSGRKIELGGGCQVRFRDYGASAVLKIVRYFSGLSSPSVAERSTIRRASPKS